MKREEYISDEAVMKRVNEAVRIELEKKKAMDVPIIVYDKETQICYHAACGGTNDDESCWFSVFYSHTPQIVVSLFWRHRYTTEHVVTPGDPEPGNVSVAAVLPAQMIGAFKPVYL